MLPFIKTWPHLFIIFTRYLVAYHGCSADNLILIVLSGLGMKSVASDAEVGRSRAHSQVQGRDSCDFALHGLLP